MHSWEIHVAGKGRGGDGLTYLGLRNGERWWQARLTWIDQRTGKKLDKQATFKANSKTLAHQERAKQLKKAQEKAAGRKRQKFGDTADEWFATIEAFGSAVSRGSHLRRIKKQFGEWWMDAIETRDLQAWFGDQKRLDGQPLDRGTANSIRDVLIAVFDYAQTKGLVDSADVARAVLPRKGGRTRADAMAEIEGVEEKRNFTSKEAIAVLQDLNAHDPEIYPLLAVMLILGCRFAEGSAVRRDCIDLSTGIVFVAWGQVRGRVGPTKGKRRRKAALGPVGLKIIQDHLRRMDELRWPGHDVLVFPREPHYQSRAVMRKTGAPRSYSAHWAYTTVYKKLRDCYERLGLDMANATHAARHTMSNLASEGAAQARLSESLVREVAGWSTAKMAAKYRHPENAEVIQLAEVVEQRLFEPSDRSKKRRR
jgi:integrase